MIITIDGPAGAGKSSVARALAQRLRFSFLDTGAMYRAVALAALRAGHDWHDAADLVDLARRSTIEVDDDRTLLDGEDVSQEIRSHEVTSATHYAANNPAVREHLVELQRRAAGQGDVVSEGRDQGTVAFPQAECKIFLTASAEERARRRLFELEARGEKLSLQQVLADQNQRDERDATREVGPLVPAADATVVTTDGLSPEQVVDRLEELVPHPDVITNLIGFAENMAERSLAKRLWYGSIQFTGRMTAASLFRVRCTGREHEPRDGGALVLSNHQSLFDPVLIGMTFNRRMNYLARETLFAFAPFRLFLQSVDSIPIDREGLGLSGLKETLRRVKQGEMVLIFPEGTRSPDGEVHSLKPGFAALAKRTKVPLVPVGIDGAYQAWPRDHAFPGVTTIHVHVGQPISPEEAQAADERELVAEVERRIRHCHAVARAGRLRAMGESAAAHSDLPSPVEKRSHLEVATRLAV